MKNLKTASSFSSLFDDYNDIFYKKPGNYSSYFDDDGNLVLEVNAIGYDEKQLDIEFTNSSIDIRGETSDNSASLRKNISLSFSINDSIDVSQAVATLQNGLLKIVFRKKIETIPKRLTINK